MTGCLVSMIFCQYSVEIEIRYPSDDVTSNFGCVFTWP